MKNQITLYIATHNITGLKYFGKTTRYFTQEDLQKSYHGSGTEWLLHLKEFGDDVTMEIHGIYNLEDVENKALVFSLINEITESELWANMKSENGLDGGTTEEATKKMLKTRKENGSYITGAKQMVETKRIKDINGEDIYTKTARKSAETMKIKGIYKDNAKKISKTRKDKKLSIGMKNPKAKIIGIYNERDELKFTCYGNFIEVCEKNDLPFGPLKQSRLKNTKGIYMEHKARIEKYEKYTGWYSRDIKEQK